MNVLQLVDEPYDSGIAHYALALASGLRERGHAVTVGGLDGRYPLERAARLGLETAAVRGLPLGVAALRRLLAARNIRLVNAHTGSSHALAVLATRALRRGPRVVRTRADSRPVRRRAASGLLWRRTSGFIAASARILEEFRGAHPALSIPARAVHLGLPEPGGGGAAEPPGGEARVGIVGRLDPVKGHDVFLRAAAKVAGKFPKAVFCAAGREENTRMEALRGTAAALGLEGRARFLGHVPDALEFMRSCEVGVVASTGSEAVSRAAIEWMSLGKPLVASAVGCLPELVEDGNTGFLVPPDDPEEMARRLAELLGDLGLRRGMGERSRGRFQELFSAGRFISDTEEFYERVLDGIPPR